MNLDSLRNRTRARFRALFIDTDFDLFSLQDRDWPFVLFSLAANWGSGKQDPEMLLYLEKVFDKHPEHLGRLLANFFSGPDIFADVRAQQLEALADPAKIVHWLDKYGDKALGSMDVRRAANSVREFAKRQEKPVSPQ